MGATNNDRKQSQMKGRQSRLILPGQSHGYVAFQGEAI